jgi:hypothetical protein
MLDVSARLSAPYDRAAVCDCRWRKNWAAPATYPAAERRAVVRPAVRRPAAHGADLVPLLSYAGPF